MSTVVVSQEHCVNHCYREYKEVGFNHMFNECPKYQKDVKNGIQESMNLCWVFQGIMEDVRNAQDGRKRDDGITYPRALQEIAKLGLEDIPEEAY
jgi:hypothetical protein